MGRLDTCGDNVTARPGGDSFVWFPGVGERPNFYSLTKWKKRTARLSKASAAVGNLFTDMVEPKQIVAKMSKSLKNVVNPDDVVRDYGADSLCLYEMFMGPLDAALALIITPALMSGRFCITRSGRV